MLRGFNNATPGQDGRRDIVRYDSPEFGGFVASASWGEDDLWDTSLTYKGEIHDFKLIGKIGYGESTDPVGTNCGGPTGGFKCTWWGAAGTVMHTDRPLSLRWLRRAEDRISASGRRHSSTTYFLQPGIERKWHRSARPPSSPSTARTTPVPTFRPPVSLNTRGADLTFYAGGVVQNIEAAAMDLYAIYRHAEGDYTNTAGGNVSIDEFDMLITGARIQF